VWGALVRPHKLDMGPLHKEEVGYFARKYIPITVDPKQALGTAVS